MASPENPTEFVHMVRAGQACGTRTDTPSYTPPRLHSCAHCLHLFQLWPGNPGQPDAPADLIRKHTVPGSLSSKLCSGSLEPPAATPARHVHWTTGTSALCCHQRNAQLPVWDRLNGISAYSTCPGRTTTQQGEGQ